MSKPQSTEAVKAKQRHMVEQATQCWGASLRHRVIVVTGGARGLGGTIAAGMLRAGARVAAADKTWTDADGIRTSLESSPHGLPLEMDVTDDAAVDAAYSAVMETFGTVDCLVNCAALVSETLFPPSGNVKTLDTGDADWELMFRVNVFGTLKVIRRFIRPMLERSTGTIINLVSSGVVTTSSGGGYFAARPWTVEMPYQASKAALTSLTFYLAEELQELGIAVNAIMPGHTRASWFDDTARAFGDEGVTYITRPVIPEHILPSILFLAAQIEGDVTGRLYDAPEWNYDHGYGDYTAWLDRNLPSDLEVMYSNVESAMPDYRRSGTPRLSFEAGAMLARIAEGRCGT